MAQFTSFRGLRYDCNRVQLSKVLCPPYDVIKGTARDELLAQDPHNIVAVELATRYGEQATEEQYAQSASLLKQWTEEGWLTRDDSAFYLYEQQFEVPGTSHIRKRRGVLGALTLEAFGKGVQPHEHTMSGPKADRLNLLRATRTNTSPIFGLVKDEDGWIDGLIRSVVETTAPTCEATTEDGVVHRLWRVLDDETVNGLEAAFENESILIADGHHRYETALNYLNETDQENGGENSVMMLCVSMQDDGLIVLPTHRVVKNVEVSQLRTKLRELFTVERLSSLEDLEGMLEEEVGTTRIGLILPNEYALLTLKDGDKPMDKTKSDAYNGLDVSVLHQLILERELGIDAAKLAAGGYVIYTIHTKEAAKYVQGGEANAAFLLRSSPVTQVQEVADAGDKMPQKSTYFFPKLVTGLVLRPLD
ncbi:hypothetical protein IAD21_04332 [Abditibacteriota bacterium]|nr:hypothetical protein IAD21_04332 [Abditibacteriota bacterium]